MVTADDVLGAIFTPHCAAIQPAKLVRGLADVLDRAGVDIHEGTRATEIGPNRVRTPAGTVRADVVVRATEGFTALLPGHRRTVAPVYSLMIATEPLPPDILRSTGFHGRPTFADLRHGVIYGQRTADDRIAFGGRGAPYHFGSRVRPEFDREPAVFRRLAATIGEFFPALTGVRITHSWGGPLGVARDWAASVGLDRRTGVAWAGGYVGDGVGTSNLAGRTLTDLITGATTELTALPWVGHQWRRWEPEPLRWLGINAGLWLADQADATESRTGRASAFGSILNRLTG